MRVLSTLGLAGVMRVLGPQFGQAHGITIEGTYEPTLKLMQRIEAGETGDAALLTQEGLDELIAAGVVAGRTDLARSFVGIAVRQGAPHPKIGTTEDVVATLLAAKSIAMSRAGASGIFFAGLLDRLGIADRVRPKATVIPNGFTAELAASGEVEIAVQQVSELMAVPGVEVVGRLPDAIAGIAVFSGGVFTAAREPGPAAALVRFLAEPAHAALFQEQGLEHFHPAPLNNPTTTP